MNEFRSRQLADAVAVGAVGPRSVRLWARAPGADALDVEVWREGELRVSRARLEHGVDPAADHTRAFTLPDELPGLGALEPDRAYGVRVRRTDGALVGEARFRTAPGEVAPRGRFAFGVASCHQPFTALGRVHRDSARMLAAAASALRARDARFLLLVGDQIYADYPPSRSLFRPAFFRVVAPPGRRDPLACTRAEVRALYHERHRIFFAVPGFAALQAALPCYPMLDDHEIRDNFGSSPEHAPGNGWDALRAGALDAFYDYQASRVLPPGAAGRPASFHHGFEYGPLAVFVTDLRSRRTADARATRAMGDGQLAELAAFLARHADKPVACVVLTIPLIHIESWMAGAVAAVTGRASDAADRWSHPTALAERDELLRTLREHQRAHPAQRLVVLSGDIHVGSLFRAEWSDGGAPLYQFTSSALSNVQGAATRWIAEQVPRTVSEMVCHDGLCARVQLVPAAAGAPARNPYGGLNLGIVEVEWGERVGVRFELVSVRPESEEPQTVYASELL